MWPPHRFPVPACSAPTAEAVDNARWESHWATSWFDLRTCAVALGGLGYTGKEEEGTQFRDDVAIASPPTRDELLCCSLSADSSGPRPLPVLPAYSELVGLRPVRGRIRR